MSGAPAVTKSCTRAWFVGFEIWVCQLKGNRGESTGKEIAHQMETGLETGLI